MAPSAFPHLPPGREPGAQSLRNRARRNFWSPFVGLVGTGMFAAGVWVAAGGRGSQFDPQEELLGGIVFALGGLLCLYGGMVMRERGRPKRHPRLGGVTLTVDLEAPRRGDEVTVAFAATHEPPGGLEVGLVCVERFDVEVHAGDATLRETREARVHEQWQPVPEAARAHACTFVVPPAAPYSYEGECVSYGWLVSARTVTRLRQDPRLEEPIWVSP